MIYLSALGTYWNEYGILRAQDYVAGSSYDPHHKSKVVSKSNWLLGMLFSGRNLINDVTVVTDCKVCLKSNYLYQLLYCI